MASPTPSAVSTDASVAPKEVRVGDDFKDFYDVVIDVLVLPTLDLKQSGWPIELSTNCEAKYNTLRPTGIAKIPKLLNAEEVEKLSALLLPADADKPRVSVVGLFDRGKTHLLNKLGKLDLGSSRRINTKGISVKLPTEGAGRGFVLLDTAGTNVPMTLQSIKEHIDALMAMKPWEPKFADTSDPNNTKDESLTTEEEEEEESETDGDKVAEKNGEDKEEEEEEDYGFVDPDITERLEKQKEEYLKEIGSKARDKAIINKQATEMFLQELIYELSDVLVVVVNELTFDDQLYIELLSRKQNLRQTANPLYVVHNYKDTRAIAQLKDLRDRYVCGCYDGKLDNVDIPVNGVNKTVEYFQSKDSKMIHVWLACEDDPEFKVESLAGRVNNDATYEFIRSRIKAATKIHKRSLLRDVCEISRSVLKELSFFKDVRSVDVFHSPTGGLVLKGRGPDTKVISKKTGKEIKGIKPLSLAPDEVITTGKGIQMQLSSDFEPRYDICYTKECMTVVVDLPGFSNSSELKTNNKLYAPKIDHRTQELSIKGQREVYWRYADQTNEGDKTVLIPTNRVFHYNSSNEGVYVHRRYGVFEKKIKVPVGYNTKKDPQWFLQFGVLQVLIMGEDETVLEPTVV